MKNGTMQHQDFHRRFDRVCHFFYFSSSLFLSSFSLLVFSSSYGTGVKALEGMNRGILRTRIVVQGANKGIFI